MQIAINQINAQIKKEIHGHKFIKEICKYFWKRYYILCNVRLSKRARPGLLCTACQQAHTPKQGRQTEKLALLWAQTEVSRIHSNENSPNDF